MVQSIEREIANFSKEQGGRIQAAKEKLKAAKASCCSVWNLQPTLGAHVPILQNLQLILVAGAPP